MNDKPHVNILIATPGRNMEAEYVKSLVQTLSFLQQSNISYLFLNQYSSQVNTAREATIMGSKALNIYSKEPLMGQITYDKIFWIDSDISWTIEDFMKLYNSEKDIVSGIYFDETMTPMASKNSDSIDLDKVIKNKEIIEADAVGFGFVCVKYGVFENISRPWFETKFVQIDEDDPSILVPLGEDFSWCYKAKEKNYKIFLDSTVILNHHKKISITYPKVEENE